MSSFRKIFNKILPASLFLIISLSFFNQLSAQDAAGVGKTLFEANCSSCHKPLEKLTGPALQGIRGKVPKGDWIYKWVHNSVLLAESGDPEAKKIRTEYQNVLMTPFPQLTNAEIDAILDYADAYKAPVVKQGDKEKSDDSHLLYGLLTIILALIGFVLLQVNSNLKKLTDEKEGIHRSEPVPFYRNKTYMMAGILLLFFIGGYFLVQWGIGLGRSKDYQPEQPIYYSHQVHAGTNQISCLYCHGGAQDSKHANIPSLNVCMNCHKAIKEYKGEDKLVREDGKEVNGTEEIEKLYSYAGWDVKSQKYNDDNNHDGLPDGARSPEWIRVHNLPDHVYFNHSQHVKVGKQQCQTCHGPIQEMPEVYQFTDLSMGWCINCHRETKVDFYNPNDHTGNKYYAIYQKYVDQMRDSVKVPGDPKGANMVNPHKALDSVTVDKIGGTECQKCHY